MAGTCAPPPPLLPPLLPPPLPLRLQTSPARRRRRRLRIPATGWAAGGWVRHRGRGGLWRRLAAPRPSSACCLGSSARGQGVAEAAKHVNMAAMAEESPSIWQNGMPPHRAARSCRTGALCPHASLLWSFHVALRSAAQHSPATAQHNAARASVESLWLHMCCRCSTDRMAPCDSGAREGSSAKGIQVGC